MNLCKSFNSSLGKKCMDACPSGGVDSSNSCRWRDGWLCHHGDGVWKVVCAFCAVSQLVTCQLGSPYVKNVSQHNLKMRLKVLLFVPHWSEPHPLCCQCIQQWQHRGGQWQWKEQNDYETANSNKEASIGGSGFSVLSLDDNCEGSIDSSIGGGLFVGSRSSSDPVDEDDNNNGSTSGIRVLYNDNKILIEEESEGVCMGSPWENRCTIIGNKEYDKEDDNKILLMIQGANLRRFDPLKNCTSMLEVLLTTISCTRVLGLVVKRTSNKCVEWRFLGKASNPRSCHLRVLMTRFITVH
jgi:hypothetical protein